MSLTQKERSQRFYAKPGNRAKSSTYNKQWREKNREKFRAHQQKYYKDNKEKQLANSKQWALDNVVQVLLNAAKRRAREKGIPVDEDLKAIDILQPTHCPILGLKLIYRAKGGKYNEASASLDKLNPELGYVKGNICIISRKANIIKSFGTAEEHRKIANWMDCAK